MRNSPNQCGAPTTDRRGVSFRPLQCRMTAPQIARFGIFCLVALLASPATHAEECESRTTARRLNIEQSTIDFETLDEKQGNYVATLKNGDLVMASFQQCGLGMHAHFYSRNPIAPEHRAQTLRWFLVAIAPSQTVYKSLEKQLGSVVEPSDKKTYSFADANEERHVFEFKVSETPLSRYVLHYTWYPPLR